MQYLELAGFLAMGHCMEEDDDRQVFNRYSILFNQRGGNAACRRSSDILNTPTTSERSFCSNGYGLPELRSFGYEDSQACFPLEFWFPSAMLLLGMPLFVILYRQKWR